MFINRIVEDLEDTVVESALIGIADVHTGTLADRFESLKLVNLSRSIFIPPCCVLLFRNV
jgi:hypothetical protein